MSSPSKENSDAAIAPSHAITVGVVVLSSGGRDDELEQLAGSLATHDVDERILVANGIELQPPHGWTLVSSPTNLGVPGGRSLGARNSTSDVLIFLDDDSTARSADLVEQTRAHFADCSELGALAYRVVVSGTDRPLRRWTPAHRKSATALADAATFPGNGHALRKHAFDAVGGYTDALFFKHEETELSWKLLDAGWNVQYASTLIVEHPETSESRNPVALRLNTRNKIWLARALLPFPLRVVTISVSQIRALASARSLANLSDLKAGLLEGFRSNPIKKSPMKWSTAVELARRGRPPIL